jgi:hypothetical protein
MGNDFLLFAGILVIVKPATSQSPITDHRLVIIILWGDETLGRHALLSRGWG